jgi:general nucleoside transport system ATP-binding protein
LSALELRGIVKRFGGVAAVDGVTLSVEAGGVLAVVGENGAGKSTLVNVACGLYRQDEGTVRVFGRELPRGSPRGAIEAGLGVVFQQLMLVPALRVWENVVLGREPRRFGVIDAARARREVGAVARQSGLDVDGDARVEAIGVAAQQRVEIVKQLWRGARVLMLDEPSALLAPAEVEGLMRTVRALAATGRGIVFISHKLREVLSVADRVAVLRRGKLMHVTRTTETSATQLAEAVMGIAPGALPDAFGREAAAGLGLTQPRAPERSRAETERSDADPGPLLVARGLRCDDDRGRPALRDLSFHIRAREILGLAGVDGNGQRELAEVLTGLRPAVGTLTLDGEEGLVRRGWARHPATARASGVVHLPEDRTGRALCLPLTVEENLALGWQRRRPYARGPLIDVVGRRRRAEELIASFDVRPRVPMSRAGNLSGGNQQKVVAARELEGGVAPRLVVAAQPTRGLDLGAAHRVHSALRQAADHGAAVLLISFDLDELRALSDRILVLYEGAATGEAPPDAGDELLGRLMLGEAA